MDIDDFYGEVEAAIAEFCDDDYKLASELIVKYADIVNDDYREGMDSLDTAEDVIDKAETNGVSVFNRRHGGPYDRGSADAYYGRSRDPHYYVGGSLMSPRVECDQMNDIQLAAYNYGYDHETDRKYYE